MRARGLSGGPGAPHVVVPQYRSVASDGVEHLRHLLAARHGRHCTARRVRQAGCGGALQRHARSEGKNASPLNSTSGRRPTSPSLRACFTYRVNRAAPPAGAFGRALMLYTAHKQTASAGARCSQA